MDNIAIIPARGGSKRIPRKNLKNFCGAPIISYPIRVALGSGLFSDVIVSTDDVEIAEIAIKYGASVPFYRSKENADDFATTDQVISEVIAKLISTGINFDNFCCIYPTSPLLSPKTLNEAYCKLLDGNFDGVFAVTEFSYPIQRGLKIENDVFKMIWPENKQKRSQELPKVYHDAGQFYWSTKTSFLESKSLWTDNTSALVLSNLLVQDIDTETDWQIAELKYRLLYEK